MNANSYVFDTENKHQHHANQNQEISKLDMNAYWERRCNAND